MTATTKAYILLVITTLGWSANSVVGKFAVGHVGPMTLTLARWTIGLAIIVAISLPQLRRDWPEIRKHWLLLIAYGAFGFTGFNALLYTALNHTSAINVVIEQAAVPGMIFAGNYLLFRTKVSSRQFAGYAITLTGVAVVASNGSLDTLMHMRFNAGDLLVLLACLCYAVYTVGLRYKPNIHWKSLMAASTAGAVLASGPLFIREMSLPGFVAPDGIGWMAVLFTALVPTLISQILFVRGVELIGANRAGLFINLIPVFGTLLSVIFLREAFLGFHFVAMALVLVGIAIAERGKL